MKLQIINDLKNEYLENMGLFSYCCVKISALPPSPALPRAQYLEQFAQPFLTQQLFAILGNTLQASVERIAASASFHQLWEDTPHIHTHSLQVSAHEELLQLIRRKGTGGALG